MKSLSEETIKRLTTVFKMHKVKIPDDFFESLDSFCRWAAERSKMTPEHCVKNQTGLRTFIYAYENLSESDRHVIACSVSEYFEEPWRDAVLDICDSEIAKAVSESLHERVGWEHTGKTWKCKDSPENFTLSGKLLMSFKAPVEYTSDTGPATLPKTTYALRQLFLSIYAVFVQNLNITPTDAEKGLFCSFMRELLKDAALVKCGLKVSDVRKQTRIARDHYFDPRKVVGGEYTAS